MRNFLPKPNLFLQDKLNLNKRTIILENGSNQKTLIQTKPYLVDDYCSGLMKNQHFMQLYNSKHPDV